MNDLSQKYEQTLMRIRTRRVTFPFEPAPWFVLMILFERYMANTGDRLRLRNRP
jgi:hypothetical protein